MVRMIIARYVHTFLFGFFLLRSKAERQHHVPLRCWWQSTSSLCSDATLTLSSGASSAVEFVKFEVSCLGYSCLCCWLGELMLWLIETLLKGPYDYEGWFWCFRCLLTDADGE